MDTFWSTAAPNWITALTTMAALVLATVGAIAAWRSLQAQVRRDHDETARARDARARTVTAHWVRRWRVQPDGTEHLEYGILLENHGPTPVLEVRIDADAAGRQCTVPLIDPLHPGVLFVRKDTKELDDRFSVKRMKDDIRRWEIIYQPDWIIRRVSFYLDAEQLEWQTRAREVGGSTS